MADNRFPLKWRLLILLFLVVYFICIHQVMKVRPDHAFLSLLILTLVLRKAKRFLVDWSPFIVLWVSYDMMRGIADDLRGRINVVGPFRMEELLFARFFGGKIPPFWFQEFQKNIDGTFLKGFLDMLASSAYSLHMAAPLLLGWVLWDLVGDREMFRKFVIAFSILSWSAFVTFYLYPAAPPWYVYRYGFAQPDLSFYSHGEASLINTDRALGFPLFETLYKHFNPNQFAAIPSLHAAYPFTVAIFAVRAFGRRASPLYLYPAIVWFSAVYLNHHYIIDIIIGIAYALCAIWVTDHIVYPLGSHIAGRIRGRGRQS